MSDIEIEITQEDRTLWSTYAPEIEFGTMTGPEMLARHRQAARERAIEEAAGVAQAAGVYWVATAIRNLQHKEG